MKVIIAGSRHMPSSSAELIPKAITWSGLQITEVVCGLAKGADLLGKRWAMQNQIPVKDFPAQWSLYGRAAGPIRNREMAEYADALIVFIWDNSRGSVNMLSQMRNLDKPTFAIYNGEGQWT